MQEKGEKFSKDGKTPQFGSVIAAKGSITFDVKVFPNDLTDRYTVQVEYSVPEPPKDVKQPIDYVFCVDVSGSMGETVDGKVPKAGEKTKIDLVLPAILSFVKKHGEADDTFSLVTFNYVGKQLYSRCSKEEFLGKESEIDETLKKLVAKNNGTSMQSAFNAIKSNQFASSNNKRSLILLTDGKDSTIYKTSPTTAAKTIRQTCGNEAQLLIASIGEDPDLDALSGLLKATDSALPYPSHISKNEHLEARVNFLADFVGGEKVTDVSFTIKIGQHEKHFEKLITNYNDLSSVRFEIDKAELMQGDELADKAQISSFSYGPHTNALNSVPTESIEVEYIQRNDKSFNKESDQALIRSVYVCLNKIIQDELIKELSKQTRLSPLKTLSAKKRAIVRTYFNELVDLQEVSKNNISEKNANYYEAMNDINQMLRILATHLQWVEMVNPIKPIVDSRISNELSNKSNAAATLPPAMLENYRKADRSAHGEEKLLQGLSNGSYEIDPEDGRIILKLSAAERHKLVDSGLDFVAAFKKIVSLAYADGDPKKREIILNGVFDLGKSNLRVDDLYAYGLDIDGLENLRKFSRDYLNSPNDEKETNDQALTRKERFNMAVFYNAKVLKLKNDKEIPASPLSNFIDNRIGLCRHHAMFIASILAINIMQKRAEGEVNLIRTTAFNYNAHAYVVYKTKKAFMLIDPVLDRVYDLKRPGELKSAAADYKRKGLPGILLSLIQKESGYTLCEMKPDTVVENHKLYVEIVGNSLKYTAKDPYDKVDVVNHEIKLSDINSKLAELKTPPTLADLQPFLPNILKIASSLGHTCEGLDPDYAVRHDDSFDIPVFDPALIASLKADENIAFADVVCAIGLQIPSDPVRPILWDEQEQKEVVSQHMYERAELLEWYENSKTDPQTRQTIVRIPEVDDAVCKQCRREIHELISQHYRCIKTEDFMSEEASLQEPADRKIQRKKRWEAKQGEQGIVKQNAASVDSPEPSKEDSSKKSPAAEQKKPGLEQRRAEEEEQRRAEEEEQRRAEEEEQRRAVAEEQRRAVAERQRRAVAENRVKNPQTDPSKVYPQQDQRSKPTDLERAKALLEEKGGAVAHKILVSIARLEDGKHNYWNPYWMNSGVKLTAIIEAVLATEQQTISVEELMKDKKSQLYLALNMPRLARVTFLGRWGIDKAKSVMTVEDKIAEPKNIL